MRSNAVASVGVHEAFKGPSCRLTQDATSRYWYRTHPHAFNAYQLALADPWSWLLVCTFNSRHDPSLLQPPEPIAHRALEDGLERLNAASSRHRELGGEFGGRERLERRPREPHAVLPHP